MAQIIKNCTSLKKYQQTVKNNPEDLKPTSCDICGCNHIWCNGLYKRSISGRDKERSKAEPVDILRFKCSKCKNHYSVLPSLIPLLRWYLWCMQQWILSMRLPIWKINGRTTVFAPNSPSYFSKLDFLLVFPF
jgi:hypothetical protein